MSNNKERTLEFDMRPRFDEATYRQILSIAKREGIAPNVLIRKWVLEAIRREELIHQELIDRGVRFSLRNDADQSPSDGETTGGWFSRFWRR